MKGAAQPGTHRDAAHAANGLLQGDLAQLRLALRGPQLLQPVLWLRDQLVNNRSAACTAAAADLSMCACIVQQKTPLHA